MGVYKRGDVWWVEVRHDGERIRRAAGRTKKDAVELLERLRSDLRRGDLGLIQRIDSPAFDQFAGEYLSYARQNKRSWTRDRATLKHQTEFFKSRRLSAIDPLDVEKYKAWRLAQNSAKGHAPCKATVDRELCCLRRMFNLAMRWKKASANPVSGDMFYNENRQRDYVVSAIEERVLLESAAPHLRPIIRLALATGMRKAEILGLQWDQVDLRRQVIRLYAEDSKNKKPDTVPLNSEMAELLQDHPRQGPYVFGGDAPILDVKRSFHTALRRAGLPLNIRFHDLRHTFATRLAASGVDAVTLMALMRHSSLRMVVRYIHPAEQGKRAAVENLVKTPTKTPTVEVFPRTKAQPVNAEVPEDKDVRKWRWGESNPRPVRCERTALAS